ncbi:MAG TPA: ROK family protein [Ktedonobacterales bacterium]|jgi:predicted NBD/HSP70 family sugar kinase
MYVAVDNGGTSTRVGITHDLTRPAIEVVDHFDTFLSYDAQMERLIKSISQLEARGIEGIGISLGGHVARDGRTVSDAVNLRDYEGKPYVRQLEQRFGCPVRMAHDVVCGLLGEKAFGALKDYDHCAYLTISTGTGGAIQLRKNGNALTVSISMGHQIIAGNPRVCLCGQTGCLETITGGKQIALHYGREASQITDVAFWQELTESLAIGIVNLCRLAYIEAVVISGGIGLHAPYLREHLTERVNALRTSDAYRLIWSELGERAPILGAAQLLITPEETIIH